MADLINGLGGRAGFGEIEVDRGLATFASVDIADALGTGFRFGGQIFDVLNVSVNGYVGFGFFASGSEREGTDLQEVFGDAPVIAPYFGNADTRTEVQAPSPGGTSLGTSSVFVDVDGDAGIVTITWDDIPYFESGTDKPNAFQLRLIDQSGVNGREVGDFDVEIRYETIGWTIGDAGDGLLGGVGSGGELALVGLSTGNKFGDEQTYLVPRGDEDALLALPMTGNTDEPGLIRFPIVGGQLAPILSVTGPGALMEGDSGVTTLTFTISRTGGTIGSLLVQYDLAGSGAAPLTDADVVGDLPLSGFVTFNAGETTKTVTLDVIGDTVLEADEAVTLSLRTDGLPSDISFSQQSATAVVLNDDTQQAPIARADTFTIAEDGTLTGSVLADNGQGSDVDPDGDPLMVSVVTLPANGSLTLSPNGDLIYRPDADFNGSDGFTYRISDGVATATATASITVTPVNDAPMAINDTFTIAEDQQLTGSVLADNGFGADGDVDGDPLTVAVSGAAASGSVSLQSDGSFTYTPNAQFSGTDTFTYILSDGNLTDTGTVTIFVDAQNDQPVAADDFFNGGEDTIVFGNVLLDNGSGVDFDPDGQPLQVTLLSTAQNGSVTLSAAGFLTYIPNADFNGTDTLTYRVSDGQLTDTATVTILVGGTNDAPVARDDNITVAEDTTASGSLFIDNGNGPDFDIDGPSLSVSGFSQPLRGTLSVTGDGQYQYTPDPGFSGTDSFTYTITDGFASDSATVRITVTPVNDAPDARDDVFSTFEDVALTGSVFANNGNGFDSDPDNDPLTVVALNGQTAAIGQAVTLASGASVTLGANGIFTYDPQAAFIDLVAGQTATDQFTYRIEDGEGGADTGTVRVTVAGRDSVISLATLTPLANEGDLGGPVYQFQVTRAGGLDAEVVVSYAVSGTGDNPASPDDFVNGGYQIGQVTLASGVSSVTFGTTAVGDFRPEADETFRVDITSAVPNTGTVQIGTGTVTGTILNDDGAFTFLGSSDRDKLKGTAIDDVADGRDDRDKLKGNDGDDVLFGGAARDTLDGGDGDDVIDGEGGDDKIKGKDGDDLIFGGTGNDRIKGDKGADTIEGGDGADRIDGKDGDDVLSGGAGTDDLKGGKGADRFVFRPDSDVEVIRDFDPEEDVIDFTAFSGFTFDTLTNVARQDGKDLVISIPVSGERLVIEKFTLAELPLSSLDFAS